MTTSKPRQKKIRMTLDITPQMDEIITDIAEKYGITKAEALRRAVGLLSAATDATADGYTVGAVSKEKESTLDQRFILR